MDTFLTTDRLLRILLVLVLPAVILSGALYVGGKMIEVRPPAHPSVTGYGEGRVSATPDTAEVTLGVQTGRQPTAEQAMAVLTRRMANVLKQLKESQGIAEKDVATTGVSLFPAYDWVDGQQIAKGFEASENILISVRDIAKVGQTITAATKAGVNQVMGVRFYVRDTSELRRVARIEAIDKAKRDAADFAENMGVRLGDISEIAESSSSPSSLQIFRGEGGMGGGAVPTSAGEQELVVSIAITYELR